MDEGEADLLQFRTGALHRLGMGYLELHARLRDRPVHRPLIAAEARLRCRAQGPDAEVLDSVDVLTVQVVVALRRMKRQPKGGDVEGPALLRVRRDYGHSRD